MPILWLSASADQPIETHKLDIELKYDRMRLYFLRFQASDLEGRATPVEFVNITKKPKGRIECLTLDLKKRNQKVRILLRWCDSHD